MLSDDRTESAQETYYVPVADEAELFVAAWRAGLPVMLLGPTGCGKTRFVEAMAEQLDRPMFTVSCHEDLTAADLIGRYVLEGDQTVWVDGPLTRAMRTGGICYLDEIVEARQDTTVVLHSVADHRRELFIDRRGGERLRAESGFGLVVSYNPGYQSVLKDLKASTRQRMVSIRFDFPPAELEEVIVIGESHVDPVHARNLVKLGQALRRLHGADLKEAASTRALVSAAHLIVQGIAPVAAAEAAIAGALTDDPELFEEIRSMAINYLSAAEITTIGTGRK